jgi:hypothetical protein
VYDVSKFLDEHPGGEEVIVAEAGEQLFIVSSFVILGGAEYRSIQDGTSAIHVGVLLPFVPRYDALCTTLY